MLELKARPMVEGNFEPLFKLEHMLKDVRHCLDLQRRWFAAVNYCASQPDSSLAAVRDAPQ